VPDARGCTTPTTPAARRRGGCDGCARSSCRPVDAPPPIRRPRRRRRRVRPVVGSAARVRGPVRRAPCHAALGSRPSRCGSSDTRSRSRPAASVRPRPRHPRRPSPVAPRSPSRHHASARRPRQRRRPRQPRIVGMAEYIYSMVRARKQVGDKLILDDVTMAFLPGARIGMVGPNGAGKSTILKIMAGLDTPSNGEAKLTPGFSVGILMQEPELDESKTVIENIQDGIAIKAKLDRFNEISAAMSDPDADFDALLAEMGVLQEEIDAADGWDLDSQLEQAMDALRTPPADAEISVLSGGEKRRVAL